MTRIWRIIPIAFFVIGCTSSNQENHISGWDISILPSSIRLDPSTNKIIENRFIVLSNDHYKENDILKKTGYSKAIVPNYMVQEASISHFNLY